MGRDLRPSSFRYLIDPLKDFAGKIGKDDYVNVKGEGLCRLSFCRVCSRKTPFRFRWKISRADRYPVQCMRCLKPDLVGSLTMVMPEGMGGDITIAYKGNLEVLDG